MSSSMMKVSPLFSFPSPVRELCPLDENTVLFCLEGDRDVYTLKLSDADERGEQKGNPGTLFCKVPYFGIPLILRGGKTGHVVVVVPSCLNEKVETIDEWVIALDSYSHYSIPSPVNGRWDGAIVFNEAVHLLESARQRVVVVPNGMIIHAPVSSAKTCTSCSSALKTRTFEIDSRLALGPNRVSFLCETGGVLFCCNDRGVTGGSYHRMWNVAVRSAVAFSSRGGESFVLVGTETGQVMRWHTKDSRDGILVEVLKGDSESELDRKISSLVLMSNGNLLFSQGMNLQVAEKAADMCAPPAATQNLPPLVSMMRELVFEGGVGADVEMVVKRETAENESAPKKQKTEKGQKVYGMKSLLSRSCEWFERTLSGEFKESSGPDAHFRVSFSSSVTSFEALRRVVLYLHTEMVESEDDVAVDAASLARFLELPWLQREAETYAETHLSVSNCTSMILAARRHGFAELRQKSIDFAAKNILEVRERPEFGDLDRETFLQVIKALPQGAN